jgi:uncharacterized SAM-binding protein YcdF (DUF218 family)
MKRQATQHDSFFECRDALTKFLFVRNEPSPVDLCFVLGCPAVSNMQPAVDLYSRGLTKRILISGYGPLPAQDKRYALARRVRGLTKKILGSGYRMPRQEPECELFKRYALARGVPKAAIFLERRATNTLENFVFSCPIIEAEFGWHNIARVAIATQPFHMRRVLMTARMHWPSHLSFIMLPSDGPGDITSDSWWKTEAARRHVLAELRAIGTYGLKGDIGGF